MFNILHWFLAVALRRGFSSDKGCRNYCICLNPKTRNIYSFPVIEDLFCENFWLNFNNTFTKIDSQRCVRCAHIFLLSNSIVNLTEPQAQTCAFLGFALNWAVHWSELSRWYPIRINFIVGRFELWIVDWLHSDDDHCSGCQLLLFGSRWAPNLGYSNREFHPIWLEHQFSSLSY